MSDPDAAPDPIDRAYVEAEAVLSDEAARAARRARVLAAVARQGAEASAPAARPRLWRRGGWLVAASVSALALVLASQLLYRPPPYPLPSKPIAAPTAPAPSTGGTAAPPSPASAQGPAPTRAEPPAAVDRLIASPPVVASAAAPAPRASPSAESAPPPPPPPPPPTPPEGDAVASAQAPAAPPANSPQPATGGADNTSVTELVVTAEKRPARQASAPAAVSAFTAQRREEVAPERAAADPGAQLRAAAAAGRVSEMEALLAHGAPVDAADGAGETALMKSVQADHPAAAALLRRHGASLDRTNQAGESAREMARAIGDAALDQAVGPGP